MSHYQTIIVESFYPQSTSGRHGEVHVRPVSGQSGLSQDLYVECSRSLVKIILLVLSLKLKVS
jgi:hypothetical protein